MTIHTVPLGDTRDGEPFEHIEETTCPCGPPVDFEDGHMLVLHNAFDGREAVEQAQAILSMPQSLPESHIDQILAESEVVVYDMGRKTTAVHLTLPCGFEMVESSACVDPNRYDQSLGYQICMERLKNRVWELEGYRAHYTPES
ncbi:MAG: Gp49 family protein [Bacteroidota bacterium]